MSDARLNIELDVETSRSELCRRKGRRSVWDRRVGLPVHHEDRRLPADRRYLLGRKEASEGNDCADLPAAGGDRIESDDSTLRDTDEGDPVVRVCETFAPDDIVDQFVECFTGGHDLRWIKRIAFRRKPLVAAPVMHGGVRGSEPGAWKAITPGRGQRHELGTRRADAVQKDDEVVEG
jgi:hypothetical protein